MAMGLLADRFHALGVDGVVRSAGFATIDQPAHGHAVEVMKTRGIDLGSHRSAMLDRSWLAGPQFTPDLVIAMARRHLRDAVLLDRSVWPHTFTLKELVRRATAVGARGRAQSMPDWVASLSAGRALADLLGDDPRDDVADPLGKPAAAYESTARELSDLIERFLQLARLPG